MKKNLFILSLIAILVIEASGQKKFLGIARNANNNISDTSSQPILFFISGESNATGYANNGFASSPELASRSLKILNNSSYVFEGLDIGTNNIINAAGSVVNCPGCVDHGMELQLANSLDSGYFGNHPAYLVKGGQGGSAISEWETTDAYYDSLINRLTRAISLIRTQTGREPVLIWLYSQGINDMLIPTSSSSWKTSTKNLFANLRSEMNTVIGYSITIPILMTRFSGMTPNDQDYETVIGEIDTEVSDCHAFSTSTDLRDTHHWQYGGHKDNIRRMLTTIQSYL